MLLMLVPILLAADALSAGDRSAIEQRVAEIFGPYATSSNTPVSWEVPIYSAETTALIAEWRDVTPENEVDALSDGDWLCQCQDWNEQAFTTRIDAIGTWNEGFAELDLTVDLGFGGPESMRMERMSFKREDGAWKLDDLFADSFPDGLKQALRETIAEDKALSGERG
jgi:hypothetical protein